MTAIGDPHFGTSPRSGTFTVVNLEVRNTSARTVTFDGSSVVGMNADGPWMNSDREAQYHANDDGSGMFSVLTPGQRITTSVAFDLPDAALLMGVQVHDSRFSRGAVISLTA